MNIRLATEEDFDQIKELLESMWDMHADKEPDYIDGGVIANINSTSYLQENHSESENSFFIVTESDGQIVGCCRGEVQTNKEKDNGVLKSEKFLYVGDLVVAERFRKRGAAQSMLSWLEDYARKNRIGMLKAKIYEFNESAQSLNTKYGFKKLYSEYFKRLD
jgi:N-acetylglutamate synthase-like GNAT family acetyltransferase